VTFQVWPVELEGLEWVAAACALKPAPSTLSWSPLELFGDRRVVHVVSACASRKGQPGVWRGVVADVAAGSSRPYAPRLCRRCARLVVADADDVRLVAVTDRQVFEVRALVAVCRLWCEVFGRDRSVPFPDDVAVRVDELVALTADEEALARFVGRQSSKSSSMSSFMLRDAVAEIAAERARATAAAVMPAVSGMSTCSLADRLNVSAAVASVVLPLEKLFEPSLFQPPAAVAEVLDEADRLFLFAGGERSAAGEGARRWLAALRSAAGECGSVDVAVARARLLVDELFGVEPLSLKHFDGCDRDVSLGVLCARWREVRDRWVAAVVVRVECAVAAALSEREWRWVQVSDVRLGELVMVLPFPMCASAGVVWVFVPAGVAELLLMSACRVRRVDGMFVWAPQPASSSQVAVVAVVDPSVASDQWLVGELCRLVGDVVPSDRLWDVSAVQLAASAALALLSAS
jgi:hypothetical protein